MNGGLGSGQDRRPLRGGVILHYKRHIYQTNHTLVRSERKTQYVSLTRWKSLQLISSLPFLCLC